MNLWIEHAQRLFLSGLTDKSAYEKAMINCQDPKIRVFLMNLFIVKKNKPEQTHTLERSIHDEASRILIRLLVSVQVINSIQEPQLIAPNQRNAIFEQINSLLDKTRKFVILQPSTSRLLCVLGIGLSHLNNYDDARIAYYEGLSIYRTLVKKDPDTYSPDLAMVLNSLGNLALKNHKYSDARHSYNEALIIRRTLAETDPDAYLSDLSMTLSNLGSLLYHLREFAAARRNFEEVLVAYRSLVKTDSDEYLPKLARTLNGLGHLLLKEGELSDARRTYEEGLAITRTLAKEKPSVFLPQLATALNSLGSLFRIIRNFSSAHSVYEEALSIRRILTKTDPDVYQPHLATSLANLGILYRVEHDYDSARIAYKDALPIWRALDGANPGAYLQEIANTLNNLGIVFDQVRDYESALYTYRESLLIWRKLAKENRDTHSADVAMTQNNIGILLCSIPKPDYSAALNAYEEALSIRRTLTKNSPKTYTADLAITLNSLGNLLLKEENYLAAKRAYTEAVLLAESDKIDHHHLNLFKNNASDAYKFLLSDLSAPDVDNAPRAFSICVAIRDGEIRSSSISQTDLIKTQKWLEAQEIERGFSCQILVANLGIYGEPILGFINKSNCQFFNLKETNVDWKSLLPTTNVDMCSQRNDSKSRHSLARICWQALPIVIQEALILKSKERNLTFISGDSFWSAFPWELLRFGDSDEDYLGLHQALPRIGGLQAEKLEKQLLVERLGSKGGTISILAPHNTGSKELLGVIDEVNTVRRLVEMRGGKVIAFALGKDANNTEIEDQLKLSPDIIYFSGHGTVIANEEFLELNNSQSTIKRVTYFGKDNIKYLAKSSGNTLFSQRPLIVLNSCHTGRTRTFGGAREDLVATLLSQGAGAVVATARTVFDDVGKALGEAMFDSNIALQPDVASVVLGARRRLALGLCKEVNSPFWGAWGMIHLHGSALAKMPFNQ